MVLLNNDLSGGVPAILEGIDQPIAPVLEAGWYNRKKSHHFGAFRGIAREFGSLVGLDPWFVDPYFGVCNQVNFQERAGEECLASNVAMVLERIAAKYAEYGIPDKPFVIVKADAGTYGMGIMTVRDASEVIGLNRKQRNKMAVVKEGLEVSSVIIQEGVPTYESIDGAIAEPVVYMLDRFVVGGFYRMHTARGRDENLNAPGAQFVPLAFETPCIPDLCGPADCAPNRFYAYGVVARLAQLAAAVEVEELVAAAQVVVA
jgi:glutamate--cysteine ligase